MTVIFSSPTIKSVMRRSSSLNFVCHRSSRSPLSISSTRSFFSTTSGTPLFFLSTLTSVSVGNGNSPASISLTCTRHSPSSSNINRMMIDTIRLIPGVSTSNASTRLGLRVAMLPVRWLRLHTSGHKRPPNPQQENVPQQHPLSDRTPVTATRGWRTVIVDTQIRRRSVTVTAVRFQTGWIVWISHGGGRGMRGSNGVCVCESRLVATATNSQRSLGQTLMQLLVVQHTRETLLEQIDARRVAQ